MSTRTSPATPFFLGLLTALGFAVLNPSAAVPPAYANGGSGDGGVYMVTNNGSQGQGRDLLFLVESTEEGKRLAIYEYSGGRLELGAVRNLDYDLAFSSWSKPGNEQRPLVKAQKEQIEKQEAARSKKRKTARQKR